MSKPNPWRSFGDSPSLQCLLLGLAAASVYGQFLWNPFVFDDLHFFNDTVHTEYLGKIFSFDLRWLPLATFEWTRALLGRDVIWLHLENLALHIANITLLFLFLRRLFGVVLLCEKTISPHPAAVNTLSQSWLAFFGALFFALHPAAVYAVSYLIQRTTLMATFFTLIMLRLFLEGTVRESRGLLIASAGAYFFAVFSKEHAIMAPAVALTLLFLLRRPSRELFRQMLPAFVLYGLIAAIVVFQIKSRHILGQNYEIYATDMLARLAKLDPGFDPQLAYPLSVLTQSLLFFKYLLLWIVPNPAWMSVDMVEDLAMRLWSWPYVAGLTGFVLYLFTAIRLLIQREMKGLLGFALLCPWLLFATEFSTVRIQESFVIYRSYLWMVCLFVAMPFLFQKLSAKFTVAILMAIALLMIPATWTRLNTFSHPLLLWDDAARLVKNKQNRPGVERIYLNRGGMFFNLERYDEAIIDYSRTIAINPEYVYAYTNRGLTYTALKKYPQALGDFTKAMELNPQSYIPYLGKAEVYEELNDMSEARLQYKASCLRGFRQGCQKFKDMHSK